MPWKWFDRVYCIHLPEDVERKAAIEKQFARVGITDVEYVHARPPANGFTISNMRRNPRLEFACGLSHIKAVSYAVADRAERPLFVEDDIEFESPERLPDALAGLPDWDVLYFGGHPRGPAELVTPHLARVSTFSFAEAYSLTDPAGFLEFWLDRIGQPNAMYDIVLGEYASIHQAFCIYPVMTRQPVAYSRIGNKVDDKSGCLNKGWKNNLSTR